MAAGLETFSTEHALNCYLRSIVHNGDIIHGRGHASGVVSQVHNVAALINDCGRNGLFPGGFTTPASLRFKICIIERRCLLRKKPFLPATGVAGGGGTGPSFPRQQMQFHRAAEATKCFQLNADIVDIENGPSW